MNFAISFEGCFSFDHLQTSVCARCDWSPAARLQWKAAVLDTGLAEVRTSYSGARIPPHIAHLTSLSSVSWLSFGFVSTSLSTCWSWVGISSEGNWKQILQCSCISGMCVSIFSTQLTAETTNLKHTYKNCILHIPLIQFPERRVLNSTNPFNNCFGHCALKVPLDFLVFFRRTIKLNQL